MSNAELGASCGECAGEIAQGVVGEHITDLDAGAGEKVDGPMQEGTHRGRSLVLEDFDVGDARGIIDRDVREHAVFALSQEPHDVGVPALIQIARSNRDREVRKKAFFWLGQTNDPRAVALFEEVLAKP
jgi:hypothetical protein